MLQAIVADWGDDLEITVTNNLQHNGTGLHWHGIRQWGSNEQDGVNGITECPIAPGSSKVYKFKATQYGTTVSLASGASYDRNVADCLSGITRTILYSMAMVSWAP
jgi:FtsP/CotA-like multicopper oxidase with cupredoxin domain